MCVCVCIYIYIHYKNLFFTSKQTDQMWHLILVRVENAEVTNMALKSYFPLFIENYN